MQISQTRPGSELKTPEERKAFAAVEQVQQNLLKLVEEKYTSAESRWLAGQLIDCLGAIGNMDSLVLGLEQLTTFTLWFPEAVDTWNAAHKMHDGIDLWQVQKDNKQQGLQLTARFEANCISHRFQDRDFQLSLCHTINSLNDQWRIAQSNTSPRQLLLMAGQQGLPGEIDANEDANEVEEEKAELSKHKRRKMRAKGLKLRQIRYCNKKSPCNLAKRAVGHPKMKRGEEGTGSHAVLEAFSCIEGLTPGAMDEICWAVATFSLEGAQAYLGRHNQELSIDTIEKIYSRVVADGTALRQLWAETGEVPEGFQFEATGGRALGIFSDGFYLQLRKEKSGRIPDDYTDHPWWMKWTESKSFVITELDEKGHPCGQRLQDGTLGHPDDMFTLLCMYLFEGGIDFDDFGYILLGSDGADWLRQRMDRLVELLVEAGVPREKIKQVVDWSHAFRKLWSISRMRKEWTGKEANQWDRDFERKHSRGPDRMRKPWEPRSKKGEHKKKGNLSKADKGRKKWVETVAEYLWIGDVDTVLEMIDELRMGRKAKKFRQARGYFEKNRDRMNYVHLRELGLPAGTGLMESAGRQTIGLRMAAAGTSWKPETAEGMIMMISYLKSGNWDMFIKMILHFRARRFKAEHPGHMMPIKQLRRRVKIVVPIRPKEKKRNSGIHDAWKERGHWVRQGGPRGNFFTIESHLSEAAA